MRTSMVGNEPNHLAKLADGGIPVFLLEEFHAVLIMLFCVFPQEASPLSACGKVSRRGSGATARLRRKTAFRAEAHFDAIMASKYARRSEEANDIRFRAHQQSHLEPCLRTWEDANCVLSVFIFNEGVLLEEIDDFLDGIHELAYQIPVPGN